MSPEYRSFFPETLNPEQLAISIQDALEPTGMTILSPKPEMVTPSGDYKRINFNLRHVVKNRLGEKTLQLTWHPTSPENLKVSVFIPRSGQKPIKLFSSRAVDEIFTGENIVGIIGTQEGIATFSDTIGIAMSRNGGIKYIR